MRHWLDLVEEVVVVDSFSTDATLEVLRANLPHPRVTWLQHPPGLYDCWNHGIAKLRTKYAYIACVGDHISREGLEALFHAAESLCAEVVLSKPRFRNPRGQLQPDIHWPIDDVISRLKISEARRMDKLEVVLFAITNLTAALTGSCASDLFRTDVLQRHPFPNDFGTTGDGPWGIRRAADLVWAVMPQRFSTFLQHPSNASLKEKATYERAPRMDRVAREAVATARKAGILSAEDCVLLRPEELLDAVSGYLDLKGQFDAQRQGARPWIFFPRAWLLRRKRNRALEHLEHLKVQVLRGIASSRS